MNKKGFVALPVLIGILVVIGLIGAIGFVIYKNQQPKVTQNIPTPQPAEATPPAPPAVTQSNESGWKTFSNSTYSFKYPPEAKLTTTDLGGSGSFVGTPEVRVDHDFTVSRSKDPNDVSICYLTTNPDLENGSKQLSKKVAINGTEFTVDKWSDFAGSGHSVSLEAYRVVRGGECFDIAMLIESGHDSSPVDIDKGFAKLREILNTFKFAL